MKRQKTKFAAILIMIALLLSGCGDKPIALTDAEEATIVNYAAHIVGKFNTRQGKGVVNVSKEEVAKNESTETTEEADTQVLDDVPSDGTATVPDTEATGMPTATLSQIVGIEGIEVTYTGAEIKDSYVDEDYFALNPTAGNNYVVVHFNLTNTSTEPITCDLLSKKFGINATINGTTQATAMTTILLDDFNTYQGTIEAGGSVDTVLLFEISKEAVASVDSIALEITQNGTSMSTNL